MKKEEPLFKIDKDVPLPPPKFDYKAFRAFLRTLEIGNSFICGRNEFPRLKSCAHSADIKITTELQESNPSCLDMSNTQYRVWRIAKHSLLLLACLVAIAGCDDSYRPIQGERLDLHRKYPAVLVESTDSYNKYQLQSSGPCFVTTDKEGLVTSLWCQQNRQ